jgi:hypothetical protein
MKIYKNYNIWGNVAPILLYRSKTGYQHKYKSLKSVKECSVLDKTKNKDIRKELEIESIKLNNRT